MHHQVMDALQAVELSREELENVVGVVGGCDKCQVPSEPSAGWICSLSGECNSDGSSCNPF